MGMENKMRICKECYVENSRATPLIHPLECLNKHTQYICGTCGRCICIECNGKNSLQRWHFPFQSLEVAKLYLRVADYTMKTSCGIYEIENTKGRVFYKIFSSNDDLKIYLQKNKSKICKNVQPIFCIEKYKEYPFTEVRKLKLAEIDKYMSEKMSSL